MPKNILVQKYSGEKEPYKREKLINSLIKGGIEKQLANKIVNKVEKELYDGIKTSEIHDKISQELKKYSLGLYHKYNLKKSIFALGPTGFPFERFTARILNEYGYKTQIDVVLQGACVAHEIDVVAIKDEKFRLVECKFHNSHCTKTDVKVPLYIKARFDDIIANPENKEFEKGKIGSAWIFTNTKFTLDAITYAECQKIRITAWNYPKDLSIQKIIEKRNLYPITIFEDIEPEILRQALENDIITIKDFVQKTKSAKEIFRQHYLRVFLEAKALLV